MEASIVLIFNGVLHGFEAILNRGVNVDFNLTFSEKVAVFKEFEESGEIDEEIIRYIEKSCSEATRNLSIRSLVILSDIKRKVLIGEFLL